MSKAFRRFEILLPLRFNDGQPIPAEFVAGTLLELRQRFGAVSCETQTIRGFWQHQDQCSATISCGYLWTPRIPRKAGDSS